MTRKMIFSTGTHNGRTFTNKDIDAIFKGVDKVDGIFSHTSKYKNNETAKIAEFENISVENGKVFADIKFDEFGKQMYEKGMFSGVSVEIPNGKLTKVGLMPLGVKPAVSGAEFEEQEVYTFEFEEKIENKGEKKVMTLDEIKKAISELGTDEANQIAKFALSKVKDKDNVKAKETGKEFSEDEPKSKSEEDIRKEIESEYAKKDKVKQFMEDNKTKIRPCDKPIFEFAISKALDESEDEKNYEFNEKKVGLAEYMEETYKVTDSLINLEDGEYASNEDLEDDEFTRGLKSVKKGEDK